MCACKVSFISVLTGLLETMLAISNGKQAVMGWTEGKIKEKGARRKEERVE